MSSSSSARVSISSDEVNLLVYRYLIDAGFKHTAFVFHGESLLHRSPSLVQADMPPGCLVTLLQKALLFLYVESHVGNDGKPINCDEPFSLLKPHEHDHGPLDSQAQSEESHFNHGSVKRSESVDDDEIRPPKKQKQKGPKQVDHTVPANETVEDGANEKAMDVVAESDQALKTEDQPDEQLVYETPVDLPEGEQEQTSIVE